MNFTRFDPPRAFAVGRSKAIQMRDCGRLELAPDEQVTLVTGTGAEYDVARKSWGFYATPSLNGRLRRFGWRAALVKNAASRFYLLLVEAGKEEEFHRYLKAEEQALVCWLDSDEALGELERKLQGVGG